MTSLETLQSALADRYQIEREIGSGGMATVYLAKDIRHKREVALKVLKPELGAVLGTERFLAEITVTANLQHPNLLPLFDSGEAGGLLFYVMPFVRGETLRAKIDRERQLAVDEAVRIAVAVASALHYAHEHGVIHRDLKPENILIQSGQPVIADFGIALAVSNAGGARVTQTGLSLGTPQYMSPEQATGDRVIDARSDIYSLGAVTYEMLSGEPPHSGASAQAVIAKLMTSEPQPLNTLRSTIPVNVACAVEKALAKLPADRFTSAKDFAEALQNPHFTIATKYGRANAEQTAAVTKWKRNALAAAAVAAVFIAVALWSLFRPDPPKQVRRYAIGLDSTEALGGSLGRMAIAADGSHFVYTTLPGPKIILRQANQLRGTVVPGVDEAYSPFLSPDGSRVGYIAPPALLKVVSLNGGPPLQISDSIAAPGGCFGPDGQIYATALNGLSLVRFAESPGAPLKRVTRVDSANGEGSHVWPYVLPNGNGILFTVRYMNRGGSAKSPAIAVANLATGKYHVLVNGVKAVYSPSGHVLYATSDGTLMVAEFDQSALKMTGDPVAITEGLRLGFSSAADFSVSRDGTLSYLTGGTGVDRELVWIGRDGKIESVDAAWKAAFNHPVISPDGKHLAVSIVSGTQADVWVKQLDRGPSLKLTFEGANSVYPTWTPDGQHITYESNISGVQDFWTKRSDGSAQAVLQLHMKHDLAEPLWSRDGKWLIVRTSTSTQGTGDILAMRPGTDSVPMPLLTSKFRELSPTLSPDGKWMAYVSEETGRNEIYVVPFPNAASAKWPLSTQGGNEPLWSHSGREIFYRDGAGNVVSIAVSTSPTFSSGATTTLFPSLGFLANNARRQYDVTADDKRFIFIRAAGGAVPDRLVFVENWFEELKRKK
ncbi:MAG: protein kinase [Gemmatimonadaceae bacterium]|nr:protein kinase [Gemmatimonadaceae bacterium]